MVTEKLCGEKTSDFELLNIHNLPVCMGNPDIKAADKGYPAEIYSLGIGKQTGAHTSLQFSLPLSYAGEIELDGETVDLFRIPEAGVSGKNLFNAASPLYLMLHDGCDGANWFLYRPSDRKAHTVKKVFNQYIPSQRRTP